MAWVWILGIILFTVAMGWLERRLLDGSRLVKRSLLQALRPDLKWPVWLSWLAGFLPLLLFQTCLVLALLGALGPSELPVHLTMVALAGFSVVDVLLSRRVGFYWVRGSKYLVEPEDLQKVPRLLWIRLPGIAVLWVIAILGFRAGLWSGSA